MRRQIFIGDIQGCATALEKLLIKLKFDPAADRLRLAGDLVNRGGESLQALRLVHSLRDSAMTVLGNHDLHLLAYATGEAPKRKRNAEFDEILQADDASDLLDWLSGQPLMWRSRKRQLALVHAGVDPRWGPKAAHARARELELALAHDARNFFAHMYGDRPRRWKPKQPHNSRLRAITNVFTRMRFCDARGRLDLQSGGDLNNIPRGFRPWFEHLHPDWSGWTLIFGHWSMLGHYENQQVVCLDSGCVWGGKLTALVVEQDRRSTVAVDCSQP